MNKQIIFLNRAIVNNEKLLFPLITIGILAYYLLPLIIDFSNTKILVFDNLDSNVVWFKILAQSNMIFASNDSIIPNMMDGLPRLSYGSEYNYILWLYYLFSAKTAYVINEVLIHSVAYISMYIFLSKQFLLNQEKHKLLLVYTGSLMFAIQPFWPSGGLSVPLMPLITYALVNIHTNKAQYTDWLIIILLPLFSSFVLVYFFFILSLFIVSLWLWKKENKFPKYLFYAMILMSTLFLLVEYRLVFSILFDSGFISHRIEFDYTSLQSLDPYRLMYIQFLNGTAHTKGTHNLFIIPIVLIAMFLSFSTKKYSIHESLVILFIIILSFIVDIWSFLLTQKLSIPILVILISFGLILSKDNKMIFVLSLIQILISFIYAYVFSSFWSDFISSVPILSGFNFSRLIFLQQFIWIILLLLSFAILINRLKLSSYAIILLIIFQTSISFERALFSNRDNHVSTLTTERYMTWNQYYDTTLLNEVKSFLNYSNHKYRVVNYGIEPAVSLFNDFYTLDGYSVNYPLEYKHEFRKIMSQTLFNSPTAANLYDNWGNKVYIYDRVTYDIEHYDPYIILESIDMNTSQIKHMGAKYILSGYEIKNSNNYNLRLIKSFESPKSFWKIHLYQVD